MAEAGAWQQTGWSLILETGDSSLKTLPWQTAGKTGELILNGLWSHVRGRMNFMLYNSIVCFRLAAIVHRALLYCLETGLDNPWLSASCMKQIGIYSPIFAVKYWICYIRRFLLHVDWSMRPGQKRRGKMAAYRLLGSNLLIKSIILTRRYKFWCSLPRVCVRTRIQAALLV